jgi:hypothetical protein
MRDVTSGSSTAKPNASPEAVVDRLFQVFHAMYGRAWADQWIGAPMDAVKVEWARSLASFDTEAIRLALESLKTSEPTKDDGRKYPPNLPEFVHICRQFVRRGPHRLALTAPRYEPPENVFKNLRKQFEAKGGE